MFDVFLALDGRLNVVMGFSKDQPFQSMFPSKTVGHAFLMLPYPSREVICYADVKRPIRTVRHNVYPSA